MYHLATALTCFPFRAVKLDSTNLLYKLENLKMKVTLKALHTKYKTWPHQFNLVKDVFDLFNNIVVLIRANRFLQQFSVDLFSYVPSICNRPSIFFFHDPIGHTHITPETLCCYSGKRFNWFSFSNDFKCFNAAVLLWYVAVHESVIQKLFPLWMNLDFQSSRETVCCALQWRCNGIVSQHQLSCTFMRPWSETELKPV